MDTSFYAKKLESLEQFKGLVVLCFWSMFLPSEGERRRNSSGSMVYYLFFFFFSFWVNWEK